ncbi:hypothetical protein BB347_13320 [Natronorubrum daqingense]|uniref:Uncharacterized protein n=1 Tax=Natronorubrum daqingense TaxID=588898 RepID=A0A1P8RFT2_9EURY|nr:hypothetical protein BB347_13320 [Natronorubrum daqingense]
MQNTNETVHGIRTRQSESQVGAADTRDDERPNSTTTRRDGHMIDGDDDTTGESTRDDDRLERDYRTRRLGPRVRG